jgi:hypothetical protein
MAMMHRCHVGNKALEGSKGQSGPRSGLLHTDYASHVKAG